MFKLCRVKCGVRRTPKTIMFEIKWSDTLGRHLVASRDITAGEVIIDEHALVQGPSPTVLSNALTPLPTVCLCLTCYKNDTSGTTVRCKNCCLAFCTENCVEAPLHVQNECKVFTRVPELRNVLNTGDFYQFITVIRCLGTKSQDPLKWKEIRALQSNPPVSGHALTGAFQYLSWELIDSLPRNKNVERKEDEDDIIKMAVHSLGALQTNSFSEIRPGKSVENLYFFSSLMAHSCQMNTDRQFDPGSSRMVVRAGLEIKRAQPITTTYVPPLNSRLERRIKLERNYGFICHCDRCEDLTEFHTNFSTFQCPTCKEMSLVRRLEDLWACESCLVVSNNPEPLMEKLKASESELAAISTEELGSWLEKMKHEAWVHPHNYLLIQVKFQFCQYVGLLSQIPEKELERKVLYAEDVIAVTEKLFPGGIFMLIGKVRFYLWLTHRELNRRKGILQSVFLEDLARKAKEILKFGLEFTDEFNMKQIIEEEYSE